MERRKLGYLLAGCSLAVGVSAGGYLWFSRFRSPVIPIQAAPPQHAASESLKPKIPKISTISAKPVTTVKLKKTKEVSIYPQGRKTAQLRLKFQFPLKSSSGSAPFGLKKGSHVALWNSIEDYLFPTSKPADPAVCFSVEYRGEGYRGSVISSKDWNKVMDLFQKSKHELSQWLKKASAKLPVKTAHFMRDKLSQVKLLRPPYLEEPDLAWRGWATLSRDEKGEPILRIGTGFIRMLMRDSGRAAFEMTRALVQVWSPSDLEAGQLDSPWQNYLHCLQLSHSDSTLERAWAVSSGLAVLLNPLPCVLPVFRDSSTLDCVATNLRPENLSSTSSTSSSSRSTE